MWHVSSRSGVATLRTAIHLLLTCYLLRPYSGAEYCDDRLCVCLSVCFLFVREHIFGTTHPICTNFLCLLPMAVARSSSGGVAIRYVLPVLWMTSRQLNVSA